VRANFTPTPLSLRLSKAALCLGVTTPLLLAACSKGGVTQQAQGESIACALGGSLQFKPDCTVERSMAEGAQVIVVRLPAGGFHRFEVSQDGQQLLAADGADQSKSALKQGRFEVILGQDRFVIPAKASAGQP
jgi:hypothetical protein